jgi:hypothetical protein
MYLSYTFEQEEMFYQQEGWLLKPCGTLDWPAQQMRSFLP